MTVENEGKTEILIDYQSYQAGYRQAVLDQVIIKVPPPESDFSLFPLVLSFLVALVIIKFSGDLNV